MASIKDEAIVLRRLDFSENSQVLAFFTREHGLQRLIAKGIKRGTKKKFATGIDLLERGSLVYWRSPGSERSLATLSEWRQLDLHLGLRNSLKHWYAAHYAAESTSGVLEEGDPHPRLYDALGLTLARLSTTEPALPEIVRFQCILLQEAGLWPDLGRCVLCGRIAPPGRSGYFSAHQGGLVCRNCQGPLPEKRLVPAAVLTALREDRYDETTVRGAFELLDYMISQSTARPSTLARHLMVGE